MALYTLHEVSLEVHQKSQATETVLTQLLQDLSCVPLQTPQRTPDLCLSVSLRASGMCLPSMARSVFQAEGFCGQEYGDDFYLTDGASLLHLQANRGRGDAYLAPTFWHHPLPLQRTFWAFGLLKLLRPRGYYSLHAAGLVTPAGRGVLMVGSSGSGKSTLTVGLVRQGWHYLSDDAVLLRLQGERVAALTFRHHCYIDADAAAAYADLPLGAAVPDRLGRPRQRLRLEEAYPGCAVAACFPHTLLLARIVPRAQSTLQPVEPSCALKHLLAQSGQQLFDYATMAQHLDVLKRLVQQTTIYELQAGRDLYQQPGRLADLLHEADEGTPWHASSSS